VSFQVRTGLKERKMETREVVKERHDMSFGKLVEPLNVSQKHIITLAVENMIETSNPC
jgi:hypothetical protein